MRKGQVSIEYLATYGWAIMVLLIMISMLTYFGVIDIKNFAPERCEIGAELACKDFTFIQDTTAGEVELKLFVANNLAERIFIYNITCKFENEDPITENFAIPKTLGAEDELEISCKTNQVNILNSNGKLKADFSMTYKKKDKPFEHDIDGFVFGQRVTS